MNNNYKKWSIEEDQTVMKFISDNPHNIKQALRDAAATLGRTFHAVHYRWYYVIAPKNMNDRTNCAFLSYGPKNVNINRKIAKEGTQSPSRTIMSKWGKILKILFGF